MRTLTTISSALLLAIGASTAGAQSNHASHKTAAERDNGAVERKCGWFAVFGCFPDRSAAYRLNDELETGLTIETEPNDFPGLKAGLFCVVKGPDSEAGARDWLATFKGESVQKGCRDLPSR